MFELFADLVQALQRHRARRALVDKLLHLDDHLLMDIGLRRDQILLPGQSRLFGAPSMTKRQTQSPSRHAAPSLRGCG